MAEITVDQVPPRVRDMYNKGFMALERGNLDYSIDLLSACVETVPEFLQARKALRAAEIQLFKSHKGGGFSKFTSSMSHMPAYLSALGTFKAGKLPQALGMVERLLRQDPLNMKYVGLFVDIAMAMSLPEMAIQMLETARDHFPQDADVMSQLGGMYRDHGMTREARQCFERLCELRPNDPAAIKSLKDALAVDSMAKDGWAQVASKGGSYRDLMKDGKEAVLLEQKDKSTKSDQDVDDLLADALEKAKKDPKNVNYHRAVARLYAQRNQFAEAMEALKRAQEINPGDPEVDGAITTTRIAEFDYQIAQFRESGDEAKAATTTAERDQFVFDDLQDRVKRYPNDMRLRFDLGVMLFENDYVNEAIQQLQMAQRSPKHRTRALYYLARCFRNKEQMDLAIEQLAKAIEELPILDDTKKDVLYEMGEIYEAMGNREKAADSYKEIYQADIGYRDIAAKIEGIYRKP